jgi:hypothetical protein
VNAHAYTNPKAKTITSTKYVPRKRIVDAFSGGGDKEAAEKVTPVQIAACQRELDATPTEHAARRKRLMWQIRRDQKQLAG